jgi:exodeoxyribonuclease V beta subunit
MSVPEDFIRGPGPHLVEASAGTGKTTWMVRTAVRLLLQDGVLPLVDRPERLLAVTFTRAATAELKERLRLDLHRAKQIRDGDVPKVNEAWMRAMLDAGGDRMSQRLDMTLAAVDRLAVTTIHGFCKGVLEEFALECGVPVALKFIESDREYLDEAVADEWRALTWAPNGVSHLVLGERRSGSKRRNHWTPRELARAARVVRQGVGAERPARVDREAELADVRALLPAIREAWNETAVRDLWSAVKWNKAGRTSAELEALCKAMRVREADGEPILADITQWARSAVEAVADKRSKVNKDRLPKELFLDACEPLRAGCERTAALLWQDAVLAVADRVERAMQNDRVAGFDEMIAYLQRAVTDEETGERLRAELAKRYDAVLVDEFQDTDWAQWTIFSRAFAIKPLVLVGDPKQSIYGFRGADITAYRAARRDAERIDASRVVSQDTNYRSDAALVNATQTLFSRTDTPFAVERSVLDFEPVVAEHKESRLSDPLRRPMVLVDLGQAPAEVQDKRVVRFIAGEVARLLRDPSVRYRGKDDQAPRALRPSEIAILVSANHQAAPLLKALRAERVPAVSGSTGDITESDTWRDVMLLIAAIEDPSDPRVVRRALATSLGGRTAHDLIQIEENAAEWRRVVDRLAEARRDWTAYGVLTALMRLTNEWNARSTLAAQTDGERRLTDLRHVVTLLQDAEREGHRNPTLLLSWAQGFEEATGSEPERRQLHLESDDEAVKISTMHAAKGLEWPVVFCGYLWKNPQDRDELPRVARFADETQRIIFSEGQVDEIPRDSALSESLRLAYVALTRAKSRTYVVWAKGQGENNAAIHHLLKAIDAAGGSPPEVLAAEQPALITRVSEDEARSVPAFPETDSAAAQLSDLSARNLTLGAAQLRSWTVSSYSRFTKGFKASVEVSEPGPVDEAEAALNDAVRADQLPAGAHTGNALHELFERLDFAAVSEPAVLEPAIVDVLIRYALPRVGADAAQLAAAAELVHRIMTTTLSEPIPGAPAPLASVPTSKTLREWRFHLPMERISASRLAAVFREHGRAWVAEAYAPMLERVSRGEIDGFLTGMVDLVAQIEGRWWVVDWKSNTLGPTAASYHDDARRQVMMHEHYVLQYHLYVVALHRFLRARLGAAYDYDRDFARVGYAFLRGLAMGAPAWFTDRPSAALVTALDDCIGGYTR